MNPSIENIKAAEALPQLLMAFHARANYIEKILNDNNWKSI